MDLKLYLGKSLGIISIGESLRKVVLAMQCSMPHVRATFLYESGSPVLNDIYITFNVDYDEELSESQRGRYLIEFDPFLQVVRAINYTVPTQSKYNTTWKISGSYNISKHRPLTVRDIVSEFGDPLRIFSAPQENVLKLLYDGLCLIFKLNHPLAKEDDIKKLGCNLTDVRLVPTEGSHFKCLVERTLLIHSLDLSLYGVVQIGLIIEEKYDQVAGINVTLPACRSLSVRSTYSTRVYFGQSCQCVMASLGSPDFVHYQQMPTTQLMIPPRNHLKSAPQQFIFNYREFGLDVVFDVEAKQVKRFIFHSNLPDHVDINMYSRCFYKFGITETGFAKKGQSFLVHPGIKWSAVASYVAGTHVRSLYKIHRGDSTNALYPHPVSSMWVLFDQLVCEITNSDCIATISVCSLCNDQQLGILGRKDEGLLVETSFQGVNIPEERPSSLLSSVDHQMAECSSDVKISLPDDDNRPQTIKPTHPNSIEVPSAEPLEESIAITSYQSTRSDLSDVYYSFVDNCNQDDERGKGYSNDCLKSYLPYAYPFQAYHPTRTNQMSPCPNNILLPMQEDASRAIPDIDRHQFVYIETFTEGSSATTCEETSDHTLRENDKWRISCYSKEEQKAIDTAVAREEEPQDMHQQSLEENFVCDSAVTMITEQSPAISDNDIVTVRPEFEEVESTSYEELQTKREENSHIDEKKEIISSNDVPMLLLESGLGVSTRMNDEADIVSEVAAVNKPVISLVENDTPQHSNGIDGDKVVAAELVYKPQAAKMAASRTQRILKTVTSLPKKRSEYQPKAKKSNSDLIKPPNTTAIAKSYDLKAISQVVPKTNSSKTALKSSTVRMDHRKVHFYSEEKSKAITAKLKPRESVKIVKRAHKDGSAYPHHHFKSGQLSALLYQSDANVDKGTDNLSDKTLSTSTLSTFNRIFAAAPDDSSRKTLNAKGTAQKLNTPFATEYNSTVYNDGEDLLVSFDDQVVSHGNQENQTISQENQAFSKDDLTASHGDQSSVIITDQGNSDHQVISACNKSITQNKATNHGSGDVTASDQVTDQSDQAINQDHLICVQDEQPTVHNGTIADQHDLAKSQGSQDNKISFNGQDHQAKQPKELGASNIHNLVKEAPFDIMTNRKGTGHEMDWSDKMSPSVDKEASILVKNNIDNLSGEVSTMVGDSNSTSVSATVCPNHIELDDTTSLLCTSENNGFSEEYETSLTTPHGKISVGM